jgi:hypothetical protein
MAANTVDTGELYRVVLFADGRTRAVPAGATAPPMPTGLSAAPSINSVSLAWSGSAFQYVVFRNGAQLTIVNHPGYTDAAVTVGETYTYAVQAVDSYGLRSGITTNISVTIDPSLNTPPTIDIRAWPTSVALGNRCIIRVNATDLDAQTLALALGVDVGSLIPHADPSIWILNPV